MFFLCLEEVLKTNNIEKKNVILSFLLVRLMQKHIKIQSNEQKLNAFPFN